MKFDYLKSKKEKELASIFLLGISVLLTILMFVKITSFLGISAQARNIVQTAIKSLNTSNSQAEQFLAQEVQLADTLIEDNLFTPRERPSEPTNPIQQVPSILNNKIMINDDERWYSVGDTYQDATIVAINATEAIIEWNGIESTYRPIDIEISSGQEDQRGRGQGRGGRGGVLAQDGNLRQGQVNSSFGASVVSSGSSAVMGVVESSSRASRFGLQEGDTVISVNGQRVNGADSLTEILENVPRGSAMEIQVMRNGTSMTVGREARTMDGGGRGGRGGGRG